MCGVRVRLPGMLPAFALLLGVALLTEPAGAAVRVVRKPVEVKHHTFALGQRPAGMPPLAPGEAAVCESRFNATVELKYTISGRKQPAGTHKVRIDVDDVLVVLTLQVDVWLPVGASDKLRAHEEGHRQIAERVYNEVSEKAARAAAGKLFAAPAPAAEAATAKAAEADAKAVLDKLQNDALEAYHDASSRAGQKVQEAYDEITGHGTEPAVSEADAIARAWARHTPPLAAKAAEARPAKAGGAATTRPAAKSATRPRTADR